MLVTCPFCRKLFSVTVKMKNHKGTTCPLCEGIFSINLNAVEVHDNYFWIRCADIDKIRSSPFHN